MELIPRWLSEFNGYDQIGGHLIAYSTVHEIKIQDQLIYLDPPIEEARAYWYTQFHKIIEIICGLKRIESSRYDQIWDESERKKNKSYGNLLLQVSPEVLMSAYETLERTLDEAEKYSNTWLRYQALWDIN